MQHVPWSTGNYSPAKAAGKKEPILQILTVVGLLSQHKLFRWKWIDRIQVDGAESHRSSAMHGEEDRCCRNSLCVIEVPNGLGALKALISVLLASSLGTRASP